MKNLFIKTFIIVSSMILLIISPAGIFASEISSTSIIINNNQFLDTASNHIYIAADDVADAERTYNTTSDIKNDSRINWHKIMGWSTLGMMAVTIGSGFIISEDGHCALAGVTTGLAVATCADGIYEYGGLISFTDGDWRYNTHAILGILATSGFITTLALADGDAHVATGIASGAVFTIALGVIYF
jgi:hypothetical protein